MGKTILGLLVTMVTVSVATAMTPITCTAGEFSKSQSGSVTCHFHENIKKSRKNFNIVQYPFNKGSSNSDAGTYVLVCNWGQGEALDCKTEDGFGFDKQVSDTIRLDVLDVKSSVGGVYVCQLIPDGGIPLETCTLKVKDLVCPNQAAVSSAVDCGTKDVIIAVLILIVIMFIIMIVFVIYFIRKRYNCVRTQRDPTKDHCICGGFTYSFQTKRQTPGGITPKAESAFMYEKNEADKEKRVGATPEAVLMLPRATLNQTNPAASSLSPPNKLTTPTASSLPPSPKHNDGERDEVQQSRLHRAPGDNAEDDRDEDWKPRTGKDPAPHRQKPGPAYRQRSQDSRTDTAQAGPPSKFNTLEEPAQTAQQIKASGYGMWTTDQVVQWLENEHFDGNVIDIFKTAKITGDMFVTTTKAKLKKLKGLDDANQKKIYTCVVKLREEANTASQLKKEQAKKESKEHNKLKK